MSQPDGPGAGIPEMPGKMLTETSLVVKCIVRKKLRRCDCREGFRRDPSLHATHLC
jgi:hypothetical protein